MARTERKADQIRDVEIFPLCNPYAEGSCTIRVGNTYLYITATVEEKVPPHVPEGEGWVTAEYAMLPRATQERNQREVSKLKKDGRSAEIQRLIGRSLRAAIDLKKLGPRQIIVDCDVLVADGGTRTAAITGGFIAMTLACYRLLMEEKITEMPISTYVAAISAGLVDGEALLDLEYSEDSHADVDMNCVMDEDGNLIEVQATAEGHTYTMEQQQELLELCKKGVERMTQMQRRILWRML